MSNDVVEFLMSHCVGRQREIVIWGGSYKALSVYNYLLSLDAELLFIGFFVRDQHAVVHDIPKDKVLFSWPVTKGGVLLIVPTENQRDAEEWLVTNGKSIEVAEWPFDCEFPFDGFDPLLGHARAGGPIEGYDIITQPITNLSSRLRLIVLGGSTSDVLFSSFKQWPRYLFEIAAENGVKNLEILCGAVSGYNSCNEVIKLIRDIGVLCPDYVISYSGANDFYRGTMDALHPFVSPYLNDVSKYTAGQNGMTLTLGPTSDENAVSVWLQNMKIMDAVCRLQGVNFCAFLQPTAFSGNVKLTTQEKRYLELRHSALTRRRFAMLQQEAARRIIEERNPHIHSLNDIFDGSTGIFYDHCHCGAVGNQLIAKAIFEKVFL